MKTIYILSALAATLIIAVSLWAYGTPDSGQQVSQPPVATVGKPPVHIPNPPNIVPLEVYQPSYPIPYNTDKSTWLMYSNPRCHYSFKYPSNLTLIFQHTTDCGQSDTFDSTDVISPVPLNFSVTVVSAPFPTLEAWLEHDYNSDGMGTPSGENFAQNNRDFIDKGGKITKMTVEGRPAQEVQESCTVRGDFASIGASTMYHNVGYHFYISDICQDARVVQLYRDILSTVQFMQ